MGTVITITNGGGSSQPVRVTAGESSAIVVPGQESYSITVPEDGKISIAEESYVDTPATPPVEPVADPTVASVKNGDVVTVYFKDGTTEVSGSPGAAVV